MYLLYMTSYNKFNDCLCNNRYSLLLLIDMKTGTVNISRPLAPAPPPPAF